MDKYKELKHQAMEILEECVSIETIHDLYIASKLTEKTYKELMDISRSRILRMDSDQKMKIANIRENKERNKYEK